MGMNFIIGCHRCRKKVFMFRGRESGVMHSFYAHHMACRQESSDNIQITTDYDEPPWSHDEDQGGYADDKNTIAAAKKGEDER